MIKKSALSIIFLFATVIHAQNNSNDSVGVLSIKDLFYQIENYHPLYQIANIQELYGTVNRSRAIGKFEPNLSFETREKKFDGKSYYNQSYFELESNTPTPISFTAGIEKNSGTYLNNESYTPIDGLGYAGLQIPLLKNLITDQRRTLLKQSKNIIEQSIFQKKSMVQNLYLDIWKGYINWYINHKQTESLQKALELSNQRLEAIKKVFLAGGCSGFDTLEISVQQQQFNARLIDNEILTLKSKILLNTHLWTISDKKEILPLMFKPQIKPTNSYFEFLDPLVIGCDIQKSLQNQPELMVTQRKLDNIGLDLKLKRNYLLPKLDLKYQYLNTGFQSFPSAGNNSRFGIAFASPLFFIGARADYKEAQYKFLETQMSLKFKQRELEQKLDALTQQIKTYRQIYMMLRQVEMGYFQLYQMEIQKFNSGEGTVFLLNSREARYWEANLKTIEHYGKFLNIMVEFLALNGTIHQFNEAIH